MRILVLGAGGFIGRHLVADLLASSHDVVGIARSVGNLADAFPQASFIAMDLAKAVRPNDWSNVLDGIDVVVNAAGLLRGPDMDLVHVEMPKALCAAALNSKVRRIVLISAISARADVGTDYAASKFAGEDVVRKSGVSWTILRPSLVYGDGSYGGTSLLRGMAGLPFFVPLPGAGEFAFTPIHARDLAHSVRRVCEGDRFAERMLEPVGPQTLNLRELLARYRGWLGFGKPRFLSVPMPVMRLFGRIGDFVGNGPIATNSLVQMVAGNAGDSDAFARAIGFVPQRLDDALRDRPAQVQDRWHARLFFLAPLLKAVLIAMWLASAWLGLFYGSEQTEELVRNLGLPDGWADPLRIGSSFLDIAIAGLLVLDRSVARTAVVQLIVVLGYTVVIGLAVPRLWFDPLGPLLKNIPVLLAILMHGVIGDKR